jgi:uncharacterized protein (TIGR03435 family)
MTAASIRLVLALSGLILPAAGQDLQFEAASLKPATPNLPNGRTGAVAPTGGPGTADPGRITYRAASLKTLLMRAYDADNFQIAGPGWLDTELFEVAATMPPNTTEEQLRAMLRTLLTDRFALKLHRETKEFPGYSLVVAKNGPKLKESGSMPAGSGAADDPRQPGPDGYFVAPQRPGLFFQLAGAGAARSSFRQYTMPALATTLQSQLQKPVSDETGLTGHYDFVLDYAREGLYFGRLRIPVSPGNPEPQPDLLAALPSQIGLRLEPKKTNAEVIVIDQASKTVKEN